MAKKKETNSARRKDKKAGPSSGRRKSCACCKDKIVHIDYKDVPMLKRFTSERGKIRSRGMTGLCRRHQTQLAEAVKRSRELALIPYAGEPANEGTRPRRGRDRDRDRD
ncbi:MAG: 30S ribosomal protein S18 [Actinomycetes bacterium]